MTMGQEKMHFYVHSFQNKMENFRLFLWNHDNEMITILFAVQ